MTAISARPQWFNIFHKITYNWNDPGAIINNELSVKSLRQPHRTLAYGITGLQSFKILQHLSTKHYLFLDNAADHTICGYIPLGQHLHFDCTEI